MCTLTCIALLHVYIGTQGIFYFTSITPNHTIEFTTKTSHKGSQAATYVH